MTETLHGFKSGSIFKTITVRDNGDRVLLFRENVWSLHSLSNGILNKIYCLKDIKPNDCLVMSENTIRIFYCEGRCSDDYCFTNKFYPEKEKESNMPTYYKVVNEQLQSITGGSDAVSYQVDKFVYPQDSKSFLFAFKTLEDAKKAIKLHQWDALGNIKVYECECHGITDYNSLQDWYPKGVGQSTLDATVFARGIKLTKLAENPENNIYLKEGTKFIWGECGHSYNAVLAQVKPNEFIALNQPDLNRMNDKTIKGNNPRMHGISLTELREFAKQFKVEIKYEG